MNSSIFKVMFEKLLDLAVWLSNVLRLLVSILYQKMLALEQGSPNYGLRAKLTHEAISSSL